MTSDTPFTPRTAEPGRSQSDRNPLDEGRNNDAQSVKEDARKAADHVRDAASDLSDKARAKAREQGDWGKEQAAGGLDDFAAAVRKASEELGSRDQSMASSLVREVAGGLEQASRTIHGKDVGELTRSVARFARERPATFLAGAALAGLALGRFARSSGEHDARDYADGRSGRGSRDRDYPVRGDRSGPGSLPAGYRSTYTDQPRPTEGAFPEGRDPVTGTRPGSSEQAADRARSSSAGTAAVTQPAFASPSEPVSSTSTTNTTSTGGNHER